MWNKPLSIENIILKKPSLGPFSKLSGEGGEQTNESCEFSSIVKPFRIIISTKLGWFYP